MRLLSSGELAPLLVIDPERFLSKLAICTGGLALGAAGALHTDTELAALGIFFLGLLYAHMVELQHQCLHDTAFRRGSVWNRVVGVLLGLPMLVSYSHYRRVHLHHHRHLGTPKDREFFGYQYDSLRSVSGLMSHFFMIPHMRTVMEGLLFAAMGRPISNVHERDRPLLRVEYLAMLGMLGLLLAAAFAFGASLPLRIWLLPFLVSLPIHALIEFPEHFGCDRSNPNVLVNTQTIQTSRLLRWFTNGNNYHVEHHSYAGVPNDKLPALHALMKSEIVRLHPSYLRFYIDSARHLHLDTARPPRDADR